MGYDGMSVAYDTGIRTERGVSFHYTHIDEVLTLLLPSSPSFFYLNYSLPSSTRNMKITRQFVLCVEDKRYARVHHGVDLFSLSVHACALFRTACQSSEGVDEKCDSRLEAIGIVLTQGR